MEVKDFTVLWIISLSVLISNICIYIGSYHAIPQTIPIHLNFAGEFDSYGSKNTVWFTFLINAIIVLALGYLIQRPHMLNYPIEITEANRSTMYQKMQKALACLAIAVSLIFLVITLVFTKLLTSDNSALILVLVISISLLPAVVIKWLAKNKN